MSASLRRITVDCPKCRQEYEDCYRSALTLAIDADREGPQERTGASTCPSCGFRIQHGMMIVREEDGVWIVEARGE